MRWELARFSLDTSTLTNPTIRIVGHLDANPAAAEQPGIFLNTLSIEETNDATSCHVGMVIK